MPEDNDRKVIISRKAVMDAWEEADAATVAETEARKEYQRLYSIAEEKRRKFRDLIDSAEDYEEGETKNEQKAD